MSKRWSKKERIRQFWLKVDIKGPNECWPWKRYTKPDGYGRVAWFDRNRQAQAVAYELTKGKIPKGHGVLHTCDNPPCCNPNHLFTGTQLVNNHDKIAKGRDRKACGEQSGRSKLTEKQVKEIKRLLKKKVYQHVIGKRFGVRQSTIGFINLGITWRHVHA